MSSSDGFVKLRRDILFHEKRMVLLNGTRVIDDFMTVLTEQLTSRKECDDDCRRALQRLVRDTTEAKISGHWDENKLQGLFRLEVPLHRVVGSQKFETPLPAETRQLEELARKAQAASEKHPVFADPNSNEALQSFLVGSKDAGFVAQDVTRMREAVASKLQVIEELDDLFTVIQESGMRVAKERATLERLRDAEAASKAAGEVALSEDAINERLDVLQRIIDVQFFQIHTIDSTVEANVKRQQSNLSQFQSACAMLDCLQDEKRLLVTNCSKDAARIERGMLYELEAKDTGRGQAIKAIQASAEHIDRLSEKQNALSQRLVDLAKLFEDTEVELKETAQERYQAVCDHLELFESSRHATLDFMELKALADEYQRKLQRTQVQHQRGVDALEGLKGLMLQSQSFAAYDFKASARSLAELQRRLSFDLNEACNEFELHALEILRRKEMYAAKLDDERAKAYSEAELRKEVFDPAAKRYMGRYKELSAELADIESAVGKLRARIEEQRTACWRKAREHLPEQEIRTVENEAEIRRLAHAEAVLDLRQALLDARDTGTIGDIEDERAALLRESQKQVTVPTKTALMKAKATSQLLLDKPTAQQVVASPGATDDGEASSAAATAITEPRNGTTDGDHPLVASSSAAAATPSSGSSSRVMAIRSAIQQAKVQVSASTTTTMTVSVATSKPESTVDAVPVAARRPPRVIGAHPNVALD